MDIKFQGVARGGSLKFNNRDQVVKFLEAMEGKPFTITLKEVKQVRSLGWNNYYWAVVIPHVRQGLIDVGYEPDELDGELVHEELKRRFLKKEIHSETTGEVMSVTKRTSKLDNKEFADFIAAIQRWSIQYLHVYIPDPNEGRGIGANTI